MKMDSRVPGVPKDGALAGCGKMRFPNPFRYYRVFGARAGSGFPTAIQRDSVAELGIFPQPARGPEAKFIETGPAGAERTRPP